MMRVLHAIRTVDARQTGGAEELLLLLCPALNEGREFEPVILLLRKPVHDADPVRDFGSRARSARLRIIGLQELRMRPRWLRLLPMRARISLIHLHGQRANYFVWIMRRLFPRTWGCVPLVATVHGWVQDNMVRRMVTRLEFATLRECDHVITVSEQQRRTLLDKGFSPDRVSVVRPGIPYLAEVARQGSPGDPARHQGNVPGNGEPGEAGAAPAGSLVSGNGDARVQRARSAARVRLGLPQEAYVISAVGRLSTEKRFDLYLEACAEIATRLPEARFLLVGGGKQEANLRALAQTLGLEARLTFTGLTRDMAGVYAATDLLMLTSDTEGTPHVLLEAMGSGIPVVATRVGGIPEFVTSEENGLLVPAGDKDALVRATLRICSDPQLAGRLIANGARTAGEFTIERMAEGVQNVYRGVLGARGVVGDQ